MVYLSSGLKRVLQEATQRSAAIYQEKNSSHTYSADDAFSAETRTTLHYACSSLFRGTYSRHRVTSLFLVNTKLPKFSNFARINYSYLLSEIELYWLIERVELTSCEILRACSEYCSQY